MGKASRLFTLGTLSFLCPSARPAVTHRLLSPFNLPFRAPRGDTVGCSSRMRSLKPLHGVFRRLLGHRGLPGVWALLGDPSRQPSESGPIGLVTWPGAPLTLRPGAAETSLCLLMLPFPSAICPESSLPLHTSSVPNQLLSSRHFFQRYISVVLYFDSIIKTLPSDNQTKPAF